jgi:two-component system response regulator AtoC
VLVRAERQAIIDILDYTQGNKTLTAQYLGIARPTLYEKLKRLGIH